jgi:F-type H+-transporting ATPase subunit delta
MSTRASGARYARALLDVVIREQIDPQQVERQLTAIADVLAGNPELQKVLTSPAVPVSGKRGVMQELVSRLAPVSPVTKILMMLADRDRLVLIPDLVAVYRERLMDHLKIVRADVTTAVPLSADRQAQLEKRLAEVTGRTVTMTTKVDPAIIGGIVARIGSTVYDGSVATQLETMRQRLLQQG